MSGQVVNCDLTAVLLEEQWKKFKNDIEKQMKELGEKDE